MARLTKGNQAHPNPVTPSSEGGPAATIVDPLWRTVKSAARPIVQRATDLTGVLTLKHDEVFLLTDAFGDVHVDSRGLGLYEGDTRLLSSYELRINGQRPVVLRTGADGAYKSILQLTNPDFLRNPQDKQNPEIVLRRQSLGIVRDRLISGGLRERIAVDNFTTHPEICKLTLRLDADFADIFEVRGFERETRGDQVRTFAGPRRVVFEYHGIDKRIRRTHVVLSEDAEVAPDEVLLLFDWTIQPGEQRVLEVRIWAEIVDEPARRDDPQLWATPPMISDDAPATAHRAWASSSTRITTSEEVIDRALQRSLADLRLLVNSGPDPGERYIAAGVPWFACLFGRDSIVTSLQLLSVRPQIAIETLELLARLQATEVDNWRDAQPGKILHELRRGELAATGEIPHTPYYGSVDSTPLWLILLGETYAWTGDRGLLDRLWPHALSALHWMDEYGDEDGDGFIEYRRHSERGLINQGWKDSVDANRMRDGRLASPPLALVEVQAYVYAARKAMARLARVRGVEALAAAQEAAAERLRHRFEEGFWMDDVGTYALALDATKRQVDAVGSNAGHALWCGIASPERAARVAATFASPDLWSGWGVRTLSSKMAGYNPIGYHIGSVWPHDNAIIAAGLVRYGFRDQAARIAAAMLEASRYFRDARIPELFCGFGRGESPYPVPYPVACSPQAWAAGSMFSLIESMLGMHANAEAGQLDLISPFVPEWLKEIRIENLRVGNGSVDLGFRRSGTMTSVEVLRKVGEISVTIQL